MSFGGAFGGFPIGLDLGEEAAPSFGSLTVDWENKIVHSNASLLDLPLLQQWLRNLEASSEGMLYSPIHTFKRIDLGGGAFFPAIDFINGYTLQFPAGNWEVKGNLNASINPIPNAYIDRTKSGAYATTSVGGSGGGGATASEVAAAVRAALATELARMDVAVSTRSRPSDGVDVRLMNGAAVIGTGVEHDKWRGGV